MSTHVYARVCAHVYMHFDTRVYAHVYTHVYTHVCLWQGLAGSRHKPIKPTTNLLIHSLHTACAIPASTIGAAGPGCTRMSIHMSIRMRIHRRCRTWMQTRAAAGRARYTGFCAGMCVGVRGRLGCLQGHVAQYYLNDRSTVIFGVLSMCTDMMCIDMQIDLGGHRCV